MIADPTQSEIRKAEPADIPALTSIGVACFKMAPEWNAPRFMINSWWQRVMDREDCLVLVAVCNDSVNGFSIYTASELVWNDISTSGPNHKISKLITMLARPAILRSKIQKRRKIQKSSDSNTPPESNQSTSDLSESHNAGKARCWKSARFFLGIIAISPTSQRSRIGSDLLAATERIAHESGDKFVRMHLDPRNHRARSFYAKHGYSPAGYSQNSLIMTKDLV